ncbi:catalase [Duganella qianjiadongensis]|uniref:Catalase n=1 Tax=Duganella qianjiadongensis TaxID=2692176 RepID=A0ABW9VM53_9BURK|nr:catalase [Duganella qianjiadongensis]MYM39685.1 catalase [Duganella qianjiadongensis]
MTTTSDNSVGAGTALSSISGPSTGELPEHSGNASPQEQLLLRKVSASQTLAAQRPANSNKPGEYGEAGRHPQTGEMHIPDEVLATASSATEPATSTKLGATPANGINRNNAPLDRVRSDSAEQRLSSNQGVPIGDNQNSLKAGIRGPTLLEDFLLREKITHFDHERIPERVVHARGSAAHGFFEAYDDLSEFTIAAPFRSAGKITPVFARFSTVAGERGSADTARDVRGFAVKFYTDDGNWDLVGNNMPVFFIQDAIKFPDLVHALKPEPHHAMPQASSAHDTYWDFVSLMPESTHMLLWQMSDRAIPRSYRTMQGFGVHTFRLINRAGDAMFCKFHWNPMAGTHSLVWDEAAKLMGADPDFHRRDLWEAIEQGAYPQWELGLQLFTEAQAESWGFDVLDATKLIPEEMVPVRPVGRMTLHRNPDNFFAETEQVAFCAAHIIPGIDFSNDPLLQGRIHSYIDTQISRLGGPNFHEIPINSPVSQVHNNQRDGMHRQAIHRGRVSYEPNSLGGGCPYQAGHQGYASFAENVSGDKLRSKPEQFAEHYAQARLFYDSQTADEQRHIIDAFRFELSKVQIPAVRTRVLANLSNVDPALAAAIADGLGMAVPPPSPVAGLTETPVYPASPALSLTARPGSSGVLARKVAILIGNGVDSEAVALAYGRLRAEGANPRLVAVRLGRYLGAQGQPLDAEISFEAGPAVYFDGVILPDGLQPDIRDNLGKLFEFMQDQYRHCKPIYAAGSARAVLQTLSFSTANQLAPRDMVLAEADAFEEGLSTFISLLASPRIYIREQ